MFLDGKHSIKIAVLLLYDTMIITWLNCKKHLPKMKVMKVKPTKTKFFREIYLQKLPLAIRTALSIHEDETLSSLAEMADKMVEVQGPQSIHNSHGHIDHLQQANPEIASITSEIQKQWRALESQSKKSSQGNPGFCWYHERFGIKATKGRKPCTFKASSGNDPASG